MPDSLDTSVAADTAHNNHAVEGLGPPGVPLGDDAPKPASIADLAEWAVGDRDLDFDEVQAGIIDHLVQQWFDRIKAPRDALAVLVEEGIVAADEARTDL
jgi:hypothetical protein